MLPFFPVIYPDELLYSVLARFHRWSRNSNWERTSKSLFGRLAYSAADLPSNIQTLCEKLSCYHELSADKFIYDNTLFPLYKPFLPQIRALKILRLMKESETGSKLMSVAGIVQHKIKPPRFLKYCPQCIVIDEERNGEPYWHRSHQVAGVHNCHIHNVWLMRSSIAVLEQRNRTAYYCLTCNSQSKDNNFFYREKYSKHFLEMARAVNWILNNNLPVIGLETIRERYFSLLHKNGFATFAGVIRRNQLIKEIKNLYGEQFLHAIHCQIEPNKQDNWVTNFLRKPCKTIHPVRHILFMRFLGVDPKSFWDFELKSYKPFGNGPWPCLNPASSHYGEAIVAKCNLVRSNETKGPIGIFTCDCGYTYSRTGPDTTKEDIYKKDRVVSYGPTWEKTILRLAEEEKESYREIGRKLNVCHHTIRKHLSKLKTPEIQLDSKLADQNERRQNCREHLINIVAGSPTLTRSQIRALAIADYTWLYRNDRGWLFKHMPSPQPAIKNLNSGIDWTRRDNELSKQVLPAAEKIKQLPGKPTRVTLKQIAKMIGTKKFNSSNLNKLPKTRKTLAAEVESLEIFHYRKLCFAADEILNSGLALTKWNILVRAGLRGRVSERIATEIDSVIKKIAAQ